MTLSSEEQLRRENEELRLRLEEAESVVRAITKHEVDAFVVEREGQDAVLVLDGVQEPYRLLTERMHQGAAILTAEGIVVYVNRRMGEVLGVAVGSLIGAQIADVLTATDPTAVSRLLRGAEGGNAEEEIEVVRADRGKFPALVNVSPFIEPSRILCLILTDLTQQKKHEAERQRLIEEQAARRAAEQVAEVLRNSDRRKDEFLAMLGHELRNPLAPLRHGLHILGLVGPKDPTLQQMREMMSRQVENLVRLVDDLLDAGRVTQGKITLQKEVSDLRVVVSRALESSRTPIEDAGHRLETQAPDRPVEVEVDIVRLTQVLTNLLNNAIKFTPRGGRIGVVLERGPREAIIRVRDTGRGIAPEMLTRIFELFAQADPSESRSEGGLGIGLTLARRLTEMHGGNLVATSPGLGKGSEFIVTLPLHQTAAAAGASGLDAAEARPNFAARGILVVDDNRDAAQSLAMILRLLGHNVREAHDGHEALTVLSEFVPDLLLLDIGLPGMNGYEVARTVRAQGRFDGTKIVALSGYGSDDDRQRSHAAGFDGHLVKPVEFSSLQALLGSLRSGPPN